MFAWRVSHFPEVFEDRETMGDLGYVGSGMLTARRKPPGQERPAGRLILQPYVRDDHGSRALV
jgi:hypothetical protein